MLRDADSRLGRALGVREKVSSPTYQKRVRVIHAAVGTIGVVMLIVLLWSYLRSNL
jgi:hypothetical protein